MPRRIRQRHLTEINICALLVEKFGEELREMWSESVDTGIEYGMSLQKVKGTWVKHRKVRGEEHEVTIPHPPNPYIFVHTHPGKEVGKLTNNDIRSLYNPLRPIIGMCAMYEESEDLCLSCLKRHSLSSEERRKISREIFDLSTKLIDEEIAPEEYDQELYNIIEGTYESCEKTIDKEG